jgi:hypothetical protein
VTWVDNSFALMGSYENLVGTACGASVPTSYLGNPDYAALCSLPQALLGIDIVVWYDLLFRFLTNNRVLFCVTLGVEIYLIFKSRSPSTQIQPRPVEEAKYNGGGLGDQNF